MHKFYFLFAVVATLAVVLALAAFSNLELSDKRYDRVKAIVQKWPYITTFVGVIAKTFNFEYGVETVTVVAAIGALLAGLMGISTSNWKLTQPQTSFNSDSFEEMMDHEEENSMSKQ